MIDERDLKPPLKDDLDLIIKMVIIGVIGTVLVSAVVWALTKDVLSVVGLLLMIGAYILLCLAKLEFEEKAVIVTLWTPHDEYVYSGGMYWRWWPFQWFCSFTTEQVIIDIPQQEIISIARDVDGVSYDAAVCKIDAALYCFWPDTAKGLCQAYRHAPNPDNHEKLLLFFTPSLASLLRRVAGRFAWIEIQESKENYINALHGEISGDENGPIHKAGIESFSFVNKEVKLPLDIADHISERQKARYLREAGKITAELERIKLTEKGKGDAEARRQILKAMEESPEMAKLLTLQEMAQGQASTIFFELPEGLKSAFSESEIPKEFRELLKAWKMFPESKKKEIMEDLKKKGTIK